MIKICSNFQASIKISTAIRAFMVFYFTFCFQKNALHAEEQLIRGRTKLRFATYRCRGVNWFYIIFTLIVLFINFVIFNFIIDKLESRSEMWLTRHIKLKERQEVCKIWYLLLQAVIACQWNKLVMGCCVFDDLACFWCIRPKRYPWRTS